jgi:WD40 repeat protein
VIDKRMRLLILLTATIGLMRSEVLGAERLPPRALARIGDHRFYHGPWVSSAVLSPDGRFLASSTWYHGFYDLRENQEVPKDGVVVTWDAVSGERLRELRVPHANIHQLAFSGDGTRLAAVYEISWKKSGVTVFATETGKRLWQKRDFDDRVRDPQYSADGKNLHLAGLPVRAFEAATGKQLRVWNPPPERKPKGDQEGVRPCWGMLSPDGKVIVWQMAVERDKDRELPWLGLRVHDAGSDKLLYQKKLNCHRAIPSIAFSADSRRLATLCDRFSLWETGGGKQVFSREIPDMKAFALTPDGRNIISYEFLSRLRWWSLGDQKPPPAAEPVFEDVETPDSWRAPQVFTADGKTLLLATHSTLRLFDVETGKERGKPNHCAAVTPRFSADGRTLFTFCAERRCCWDVSGKEPVRLSHEPRKRWEFECLAHSADDRIFLDRDDDRNHARVRETATGRILRTLEPYYARFGQASAGVFACPGPRNQPFLCRSEENQQGVSALLHGLFAGPSPPGGRRAEQRHGSPDRDCQRQGARGVRRPSRRRSRIGFLSRR